MSSTMQRRYQFGEFFLDANERLLESEKGTHTLPPKVFDTLVLLVENSNRVLSKEEVLEKVWADSFVEENNLQQHISLLRKILGNDSITTVSKFGYKFAFQVKSVEDSTKESHQNGFISVNKLQKQLAGILSDYNNSDFTPPAPPQIVKPKTYYAKAKDVNIAYQVVGEGELDIVFVMGWISHLEYFWEEPSFARFLRRLASFSRLILFDKRGTGLSDRVPVDELPTLEQRMEDLHAVMDAAGSERAALVGVSEGGPMCSLFAATYPERTVALAMIGTYAKRIYEADYPWAPTAAERERFLTHLKENWGKAVGVEERAPSRAEDAEFRRWWAAYLRMGASPGAAVALTRMNAEIDVRNVLPSVRVPSLVIHRTGDLCLKVEEGRYVASLIPGCQYVELSGTDHLPFVGEQDEILDEIEEFLTGMRHRADYDRVLATVVRIEIVAPAEQQREFGARRWFELLEGAKAFVRSQVKLFKGREVEFNAAGLLAAFDGPARAVRCAAAITASAKRLGVRVKAGLHTGECDLLADGRVAGVAVRLCEEVAQQAAVGEVLVSRTVKDLVAGSGLRFEDKGLYFLTNSAGEWRLFKTLT